MTKDLNSVINLNDSEAVKAIPKCQNTIIHSRVKGFEHVYCKQPTTSVKYVISGEESYRIDGHTYRVKTDEFLIVNHDRVYEGFTSNQIETEGVCLYLHNAILGDVFRVLDQSTSNLLDNPFEQSLQKFEFLENIYKSGKNTLGVLLRKLYRDIRQQSLRSIKEDRDLYYIFAESLLFDQHRVFEAVSRLSSIKSSTKKELYRRVLLAKEYLDDYYYQKLDINKISQIAALSEYHFFRTFKQVFGISPHKYLIQRRLQRASELLKEQNHTITEVAYLIGFPDIHSFSKSFKKEFGITPTRFISQKRSA
ncbi:hypothetical protein BKI52_10315 [marine bacterium AO1-C]|nr:hypothetical protein BKI52_10315 [marine bacterium AO1-C]